VAVRLLKKLRRVFSSALLVFTLTGVCLAPQAPPEPSLAERDLLAQQYLTTSLARWQQRLRLEHWTVSVKLAKPEKLRRGTLGNIHWDEPTKTAVIRVLSAAEYPMPYRGALRDMEFTLVHELIHLELASLPRSDASRTDEEHAVNHMAEALLRLDRHE